MFRILVAALAVVWLAVPAGAATLTMTLDNLPRDLLYSGGSYTEDGITVAPVGGGLGHHGGTDAVHLDDFGTEFTHRLVFTTGSFFDVLQPTSFASLSQMQRCISFDCEAVDFDTVTVQGYRRGELVVERVGMSVLIDDAFTQLDAFAVQVNRTDLRYKTVDGWTYLCPTGQCTHTDFAGVVFEEAAAPELPPPPEPVPLPASGLLLAAGLAGLPRLRRA